MSLAHGVFARDLQDTARESVYVPIARLASEVEADAVGEFLPVEVGRVGGFEVGEVEFLAWAALGEVGLLGGGRGEMEVAGFVEGDPAAFPELREGREVSFREFD